MRERSNHIQIINFNEWPISSAESAANFTPHNCSPHYRHTSPLSIFVTLHHHQHYHHNLLLGAMQCASSAMIAPLLRSCSLSLSLARRWLCAVQATPIIGCANCRLCVRVRVNALLAQHCWQRRCVAVAVAACIFIREQAASSRQRQHCVCNCICICVCVSAAVGVRCVCVCVRIFRLISIFRSARFQA